MGYFGKGEISKDYFKLLLRWHGSIYKLLYSEFIIFIAIYYVIALVNKNLLSETNQEYFSKVCEYCLYLSETIPIAFVLAFFVPLVVSRRFQQFKMIPWIDKMAIYLSAFLQGLTDDIVIKRRTIIRYMILSMTLCFRSISKPVMDSFESYEQLINAGLATQEEIVKIDSIPFSYNRYFVPLIWAGDIIHRADKHGLISGERCMALLLNEVMSFHEELQSILFFDWISIPLVYTQISTFCTYAYFICTVFGGQILGVKMFINFKNSTKQTGNMTINYDEITAYLMYFPIFFIIQFLIYMGWLKVAEAMINPYGYDDEDFQMVSLIERNLQIGYVIVDKINNFPPKVTEDVVPIYIKPNFNTLLIDKELFPTTTMIDDENVEFLEKSSAMNRKNLLFGSNMMDDINIIATEEQNSDK